jgi:hypothetical protein
LRVIYIRTSIRKSDAENLILGNEIPMEIKEQHSGDKAAEK